MSRVSQNILVHVCCAACASYLLMELEKENFNTVLFFYNPDCSEMEYKELMAGVKLLSQKRQHKLICPERNPAKFIELINPFQDKQSIKYINDEERFLRKKRDILISLIITETISEARNIRYSNITSAMLCSPYRDHNTIWDMGNRTADENKMNFFYKDFRKGYWMGRNFARNNNLYIPDYCSDYLT